MIIKSSSIYGGGGFVYDTSLDGADSIQLSKSLTASLVQANGGNDSMYLSGVVENSTVYGGQGADLISQISGTSITNSHLAGNRGSDKLVLQGATTILNSTILGGDISGTLAGNDSLSLAVNTLQTSTVYGGAGNDTIAFAATQVIETDVKAFAGADSLSVTGSFVSTTVSAGAGADTLFINTSTAGSTDLLLPLSMVVRVLT